jgi:hypothetical protein
MSTSAFVLAFLSAFADGFENPIFHRLIFENNTPLIGRWPMSFDNLGTAHRTETMSFQKSSSWLSALFSPLA